MLNVLCVPLLCSTLVDFGITILVILYAIFVMFISTVIIKSGAKGEMRNDTFDAVRY